MAYCIAVVFAFLAVLSVLGLVIVQPANASECKAQGVTDRFDNDFKKSVRRYWSPPYSNHWCIFKAQCYQESLLNPDAVSSAGAVGLCQLMKGTYTDEVRRLNLRELGRRNPSHNIEVGVIYMAKMLNVWRAPRPNDCRIKLALASYNAGAGNIIKAQTESGGRKCWDLIQGHLHKITGDHSIETIAYVSRIFDIWRRLKGLTI